MEAIRETNFVNNMADLMEAFENLTSSHINMADRIEACAGGHFTYLVTFISDKYFIIDGKKCSLTYWLSFSWYQTCNVRVVQTLLRFS